MLGMCCDFHFYIRFVCLVNSKGSVKLKRKSGLFSLSFKYSKSENLEDEMMAMATVSIQKNWFFIGSLAALK